MLDANEQALNNYLDKQEQQEKTLENFIIDTESIIDEINDLKEQLYNLAKDYNGYDFTEDLKDML